MQLRIFIEPQQGADYATLLRVAQATEDLGFDAFFRSDHYLKMGPVSGLPGPTDAWTDAGRPGPPDATDPAGHAGLPGDLPASGPARHQRGPGRTR